MRMEKKTFKASDNIVIKIPDNFIINKITKSYCKKIVNN